MTEPLDPTLEPTTATEPPAPQPSTRQLVYTLVRCAEHALVAVKSGDADRVITQVRHCMALCSDVMGDYGLTEEGTRVSLTEAGEHALDAHLAGEEPEFVNRAQLLSLAARAVRLRGRAYGPPGPFLDQVAALWAAQLGHKVTPHQVSVCMILFKLARINIDPSHVDSWIDVAGYAAIGAEAATEGVA